MTRLGLIGLTAAGIVAAGVTAVALGSDTGTGSMPTSTSRESVDLAAGERLYGDFCAACHGANLEGQDDWRSPGPDGRLPAPPHDETGHTWHHSDQVLFDYTKYGGRELMARRGMDFDSGMPGFSDQLSDAEIHAVLAYIKSTWPTRIQDIQAERSAAPTE